MLLQSGKILAVGTAEELGARGVLNYTQPDQKEAVRKGGIFGRIRRGRAGKRPGSVAGSEASTSASTMTVGGPFCLVSTSGDCQGEQWSR